MAVTVSEKLYYKIGEVAEILKVNSSVLRFWETQFAQLAPSKTKTGQRLYSRQELELLQEIYRLLYTEKLTIAGAKAKLALDRRDKNKPEPCRSDFIQTICQELKEIRKLLQ